MLCLKAISKLPSYRKKSQNVTVCFKRPLNSRKPYKASSQIQMKERYL